MPLLSMIQMQGKTRGHKTAVIDGQHTLSYNELNILIHQLANGLQSNGITKGDRVGFFLEDCYQEILCYFSCFSIGAIAVPLYEGLRGDDLTALIEQTTPKVIFTSTRLAPHINNMNKSLLQHIDVYQVDNKSDPHGYASLFMEQTNNKMTLIDDNSVALISYTSGSTAQPKGVMHTQKQLIANSKSVIKKFNLSEDTITLVSDLDFNASFSSFLVTTLLCGGTVIISNAITATERLEEISKYKITFMFNVPSSCDALTKAKQENPNIQHQLQYFIIGGDHYSPELFKQFNKAFGLDLIPGMGMTETLYQSSMGPTHHDKMGSAGSAMPGVTLKIIDNNGRDLPPNQLGELCISSPSMMLGYWNNPSATKQAIHGSWIHSGDLGYLDNEGYFWFIDRRKNIIIVDGDNVAPREVENVLCKHKAVGVAVVVGKQEYNNSVVCAFVKPHKNNVTDSNTLIEFCKQHLADFKVPKKIIFLDEMPTNARGKIDRTALINLI